MERKANNKPDYCSSCATSRVWSERRDKIVEDVFDKIKCICDTHGYELVTRPDEYIGNKMKIQFVCKYHGIQTMLLNNFLRGHTCIKCSYELRRDNMRNSQDYVESVINSMNGNKLLNKEEYVQSNKRNLKVLCGKCGSHVYTVSFSDYYNNKVYQCHSCSSKETSGEKLIADILTELKIEYIREYKFRDCIDKRPLPFDFYLPNYNTVIEFDGPQHYHNVYGQQSFINTQKHDIIKDQYCSENCINIIRIPYFDSHKAKEQIINQIQNTL